MVIFTLCINQNDELDEYLSYGARVVCFTMFMVVVKLLQQIALKQLLFCGKMISVLMLNLTLKERVFKQTNKQNKTKIHAFVMFFFFGHVPIT